MKYIRKDVGTDQCRAEKSGLTSSKQPSLGVDYYYGVAVFPLGAMWNGVK